MLKSYLIVFFISMLPLVELRGAIPVGIGMGLPILPTYLVCVVGNMLPVPFIYLFARKLLIWGYHKPLIGPFCHFCIVKGEKGGRALEAKAGRGLVAALLLFVGIPLPGTGAWTGTLAASLLNMGFKKSILACMGGVVLAGVIMGTLSLLGVSPEECAIIGDRMDTDVISGMESGMSTVLVLSGVSTRETLKSYAFRPSIVLNGVGDIPGCNM